MEQKDLVMIGNVLAMLKRSVFRELQFQDVLGLYQSANWVAELKKEIENDVKVSEALAKATCIDPGPAVAAPIEAKKPKAKGK